MPKVEGGSLEKCMEICLTDEALKKEVKSQKKRQQMCYAACKQKYNATEETFEEYLINKYKEV